MEWRAVTPVDAEDAIAEVPSEWFVSPATAKISLKRVHGVNILTRVGMTSIGGVSFFLATCCARSNPYTPRATN